jgi:hypothetical protein
VLSSTHWSMVYAFLMMYSVAAIWYTFAVSTFFHDGTVIRRVCACHICRQ